jgi:hypothetical protein
MLRRLVPCLLAIASTTASAQADQPGLAFDSTAGTPLRADSAQQPPDRDTAVATRAASESKPRAQRLRWLSPDRLVLTAGTSFASPQSAWLGRTPERDVYYSAIRFAWRLGRIFGTTASYALDLHPVVALAGNPAKFIEATRCDGGYAGGPVVMDAASGPGYLEEFGMCAMHRTAFGGGASPIGLVIERPVVGRLSASGELTVGGLLFTDPMPYPNGSKFNYFLGVGFALEFAISPRSAAGIRYRLDHMSNAGMGEFNPGLGTHSIHLGVSRALRAKPPGRNAL